MKKLFSLLVIFLLVAICTWLLFGETLRASFVPNAESAGLGLYALAQDSRGGVYYARVADGKNGIVALDSSGNTLLEEALPVVTNAEDYNIEQLFAASNKTLLAAVSKLDRRTERVSAVSLQLFYESGAYGQEVLSVDCDQPAYRQGSGVFFGQPSETETHILFGLQQEGRLRVYRLQKGAVDAAPELLRDLAPQTAPLRFAVLSDGGVLTVTAQGTLEYYAVGARQPVVLQGEGMAVDGLFATADGGVYLHDVAKGDIWKLTPQSQALQLECDGSRTVDTRSGLRFSQLRAVCVSSGGRIAGLWEDEGHSVLYAGTQTYMYAADQTGKGAGRGSLLAGVAICVGGLLASLLLWDAYVRLLKMRLSIMVRQTLLIGVGVSSMVYLLLTLIVAPRLQTVLEEQYTSRIRAAAEVLGSAVAFADDETAHHLIQNAALAQEGDAPIHFDLFAVSADDAVLTASGDGAPAGMSADQLPYRGPLRRLVLSAAETGAAQAQREEVCGPRSYALLRLDDGRVLAASAGKESIAAQIQSVTNDVIGFLIFGGGMLALLLLLIELLTVHSIRKLKRGVDAVSAGDYAVSIDIRSGDEVENLANSFNTMTKLVRTNMQKLNRMNASFFRFVPESMIRLLGAESVEQLDRGSCVKKHMTMLVVRFAFDKAAQTTETLFGNSNEALQALTSAVSENNGTVYDLQFNGFNAVFADDPEDAVRAALLVRQNAMAFALRRREAGLDEADVRLVLTTGDVMLGVVGDALRLSPTAISDSIADAESIMALCRPSNIYICCTQSLLASMRSYRSRYVGLFDTGHASVRLYDLFDGDPFGSLKHKEMCLEKFNAAIEAFYKRDFAKAKALFMEIIKLSIQDTTSVNYMYFADKYMREPPETLHYHTTDRA